MNLSTEKHQTELATLHADTSILTLMLNPSRSLITPETADRITTRVMLQIKGFIVRPYSLNGVSNSCHQKRKVKGLVLLRNVDSCFMLWTIQVSTVHTDPSGFQTATFPIPTQKCQALDPRCSCKVCALLLPKWAPQKYPSNGQTSFYQVLTRQRVTQF